LFFSIEKPVGASAVKHLIPEPHPNERPAAYADRVGRWYLSERTDARKKEFGQYFTPLQISDFMAGLFTSSAKQMRILDPAAGAGILSCSSCESFAAGRGHQGTLHLEAYEVDPDLCGVLGKVLQYLSDYLAGKAVNLKFEVHCEDFILKHAHSLDDSGELPGGHNGHAFYDACVSNPPYFKLAKNDPRAKAASAAVHGQPNIYSLFMVVSASLLCEKGQLVFITPRSFASGPYFQRFRQRFFRLMKPERVHVFDSRRDAFRKDDVLQENIVIKARREPFKPKDLMAISSSQGIPQANELEIRKVPLGMVLDMKTKERVLKIPINARQEFALKQVGQWHGSLSKYGLRVSTGPVVAFRARRHIECEPPDTDQYAPLLWMQHVRPMRVTWPRMLVKKPQYIRVSPESMRLLVPNMNYVLLHRFSAKEQARRLTAAPLTRGTMKSLFVGIENHLNYIYKAEGELSEDEAWGLAVLYNNDCLEEYFRALNGNTQVSATELRSIPLPARDLIIHIGKKARALSGSIEDIHAQVSQLLAHVI
jgi:adenine-specific DNA-methyltransferase